MLDCIYDATLTFPPPPGNPKAFDCCVYPGEDGIFEPYLSGQGHLNWSFKPNKRFLLEEFEGKEFALMSVRPFSPRTMMLTRNKNPPTKELILDFAKFL